MSVGAYTTAICMMRGGLPLLPSILIGGLVSAVSGIIIGIPTLRLRGDYLAITTLGFAEIIRVIMVNLGGLTGGAAGLKGIPSFADTGDFVLDLIIKFAWIFAFTILTIVLVSNLIRSSTGRALISIREDEIASSAMGINIAYYKVFAFTMSAFIAGVGGGLYAIIFGYLNPVMFGFINSVNFVVIVVLGGLGSITGTIISGVGFTFIQEWLREFQDFRLVIFGFVLIFAMIFWRKGLMGSSEISVVQMVRNLLAGEYKPSKIYSALSARFKESYSRLSARFNKKSKGVK
jgi:branched-chain amino acid transport system permease protein